MTIKLGTRTVYRCVCNLCGHQWESAHKPRRCAACKRFSWNGEDRRFREAQAGTARRDGKPPQINHRALLDALTGAQGFLVQLIHDFGPCNHAAVPPVCVCEEAAALKRVDAQIATMKLFTEAKP